MNTKKYTAAFVAAAAVATLAGCSSPSDISNNLGGATRDNSAYRYNYDYSGGDMGDGWTNGTYGTNKNSRGAAYWDYYGITNGSANDSMTGMYTGPNTAYDSTYGTQSIYGRNGAGVYGTPSNDAATTKSVTMGTTDVNSAAVAD